MLAEPSVTVCADLLAQQQAAAQEALQAKRRKSIQEVERQRQKRQGADHGMAATVAMAVTTVAGAAVMVAQAVSNASVIAISAQEAVLAERSARVQAEIVAQQESANAESRVAEAAQQAEERWILENGRRLKAEADLAAAHQLHSPVPRTEFEETQLLGSGGFGQVHVAYRKGRRSEGSFAMKRMLDEGITAEDSGARLKAEERCAYFRR